MKSVVSYYFSSISSISILIFLAGCTQAPQIPFQNATDGASTGQGGPGGNNSGASCSFNNQSIASGGSVQAYQSATVPFGQTCLSEMRTCTNGSFSGDNSYSFSSCSVGNAVSCSFNNQAVANGASVTAYQSASVAFGQTCASESRLCTNGILSGDASYTFASCTVGAAAGCSLGNQSVASGSGITAYQSSSVPYGQTCTSENRVCTNGILSGDASYTFASCTVGAASSCSFNGQTVASGSSVQAYPSPKVSYGQTCALVSSKCTNGVFDQTIWPSCVVGCQIDGQDIFGDGSSIIAYSASTAPAGQTCSSISESLYCNNGVTTPANYSTYSYSSCAAPKTVTLTVAVTQTGTGQVKSTDGGINCSATGPLGGCTHSYTLGSQVTLTATETNGPFIGWEDEDQNDQAVAGCAAGTDAGGNCTITMSGNRDIFADFSLPTVASVSVTAPTASDKTYYFVVYFNTLSSFTTDGAYLFCGPNYADGYQLNYIVDASGYPINQANYKVSVSGIPAYPSGTMCEIQATDGYAGASAVSAPFVVY